MVDNISCITMQKYSDIAYNCYKNRKKYDMYKNMKKLDNFNPLLDQIWINPTVGLSKTIWLY